MTVAKVLKDFYKMGVLYARDAKEVTVLSLMEAAISVFDTYCERHSHLQFDPNDFREYAISAFIDGFGNPE